MAWLLNDTGERNLLGHEEVGKEGYWMYGNEMKTIPIIHIGAFKLVMFMLRVLYPEGRLV